jgi:hypothetical protein
MACEDSPLDSQRVQQRHDVGREVLDAVARLRLARLAVPALGHGDGADIIRQEVEHGLI